MDSLGFFATHSVFTHEEFARSRSEGSPRTVDSLLRKHVASGRIVRVRRRLYAALQFHGRAYSVWSQVTFFSRRNTRAFRFGSTEFVPVQPQALSRSSLIWAEAWSSSLTLEGGFA